MSQHAPNFQPSPAEPAVEPFIDKHEVARRMGCTTRTVDNMMRRGFIPFYKLGFRAAFRWSEIQSHLAQTCRVATQGEKLKTEMGERHLTPALSPTEAEREKNRKR